jgi:formylglycine-generating enzyme required for sulfatase activity
MGSDDGRPDERPAHDVELRAFRIGRIPVTCAQYAPFLESGRASAPPAWPGPGTETGELPVTALTWFEATAFADWLSEMTGERWRLPSEAEWERAARGGLEGAATSWGDSLPPGEIPQGSLTGPWPAGRGAPNAYGLFDMGTIVHEWCGDWYAADYYERSPRLDPRGPDEGARRASRGGSWRHHVRWSPPGARSSLPPEYRYADYGFRLVQEIV